MRRILIFLMLITVTSGMAQERFDYVQRRNAWNGGVNAAGIRMDSLSRSYAEIYATKENGGMAGHSTSDNSWNAGVCTESIRHFKRVSFAGGFTYDHFQGRNMKGSMFTDPGYYPVDILEFTPGRKTRETYAFDGAMSAVLGRRWTAGMKVDFLARNYAKRKDLRHKNTRLDFEASPGVMFHAGRFAVGAAYILGLNSEKVEAEGFGPNSQLCEAFFDRGLSFGSQEAWGSNDIHLTQAGVSGFPIKEFTQGAGLQVQWGPLYADATYRTRGGESGERGIIWHEYNASLVDARVVLALGKRRARHFVRLNMNWQSQLNNENILTFENVNGVSNPHLHGSAPIFRRKSLDLNAEYEWMADRTNLRLGGRYSRLNRESLLMYPYLKGQTLGYAVLWGSVTQRFGFWDVTLSGELRKGRFNEREKLFATTTVPGEYPQQLTDYYNYENEYLTAGRIGVGFGVRRHIHRFYIDLTAHYERGLKLIYVPDANRVRATLRVGYNF